jgi:hypothetical protein
MDILVGEATNSFSKDLCSNEEIIPVITDFKLSQSLYVDAILVWLQRVLVGNVVDVSGLHTAFLFSIEALIMIYSSIYFCLSYKTRSL